MRKIRIPNDEPETWVLKMPKEDTEDAPERPPVRHDVLADRVVIDPRARREERSR